MGNPEKIDQHSNRHERYHREKTIVNLLSPDPNKIQTYQFIEGEKTVTIVRTTIKDPEIDSGLLSVSRKIIFTPETINLIDEYLKEFLSTVNHEKHEKDEYFMTLRAGPNINKVRSIFVKKGLLPAAY